MPSWRDVLGVWLPRVSYLNLWPSAHKSIDITMLTCGLDLLRRWLKGGLSVRHTLGGTLSETYSLISGRFVRLSGPNRRHDLSVFSFDDAQLAYAD